MLIEIQDGLGEIIWIDHNPINSIRIEKITDENEHDMIVLCSDQIYYKIRYYCYEEALTTAREVAREISRIEAGSCKAVPC